MAKTLNAPPAPHLEIVRFELSCGAKLFVSPRPGAPVTAAQIHMRGGHSLDDPERAGEAYLTGRLVDQGTRQRTADELALELDPHGGNLHGTFLLSNRQPSVERCNASE